MPTSRKPKKAFIQFAIAALVAVLLGIGGISITFMMIQSVSSHAEQDRQLALKKAEKAEKELLQLKEHLSSSSQNIELQATQDIPAGVPIQKGMFKIVTLPTQARLGALSSEQQVFGKMAQTRIAVGDALTTGNTVSQGLLALKSGQRAIAIPVDNVGGLNGALVPGNFVDVLITLTLGDEKISKTLLQNVAVIGMGGDAESPKSSGGSSSTSHAAGSVILAVSPAEAEKLTLASEQGKFHLTLRSLGDSSRLKGMGTDMRQLVSGVSPSSHVTHLPPRPLRLSSPQAWFQPVHWGGEMAALPAPTPPEIHKKTFTMEVYRASGKEPLTFETDQ